MYIIPCMCLRNFPFKFNVSISIELISLDACLFLLSMSVYLCWWWYFVRLYHSMFFLIPEHTKKCGFNEIQAVVSHGGRH